MKSLKHIGKLEGTNSRVLVAFRTLPGESDHCLVLPVNKLQPEDHDTIMTLVETAQAQDAFEFGEVMFMRTLSDSRPILQAMNQDRCLVRVATDKIIMTPNTMNEIKLSELNTLIAEQKNCAIDDLYTFVSGAKKIDTSVQEMGRDVGEPELPEQNPQAEHEAAKTTAESYTDTPAHPVTGMEVVEDVIETGEGVIDDKQLAATYRSQADTMFKEAQRLRKEAEELDPATAKKAAPKVAAKPKTKKAAKPKAAKKAEA